MTNASPLGNVDQGAISRPSLSTQIPKHRFPAWLASMIVLSRPSHRNKHSTQMATAYIETTIPSLYVGRPSTRLVEAARQIITKRWWDEYRHEFDLVCSQTVIDECCEGDPAMSKERLRLLDGIPLLELTDDVRRIAEFLLQRQVIPPKAADDAIHIAVASVHRADFLVTWNCKHLANPRNWRRISDCVAQFGYRATVICTPEDLIGDDN